MNYSHVTQQQMINITSYSKEQILEQVKYYCGAINMTRPIICVIISAILTIIEYLIIGWVLRNPKANIYYERINDKFFVKFTRLDVWIFIATLKIIFLLLTIIFISQGVGLLV